MALLVKLCRSHGFDVASITKKRGIDVVANIMTRRGLTLESLERAAKKKAATHFIESMEQNSKIIVSNTFRFRLGQLNIL